MNTKIKKMYRAPWLVVTAHVSFQFNSIQFYSCSIISTTGKVTSQIKTCTSHRAVIKYIQISMKLDTHYIYTLQEDIYK
jgi:hypothetical protein